KKIIGSTPTIPGIIKITNRTNEINYYNCENMHEWLSHHLALSWDRKEYVNSVSEINFVSTGSFMASCLKGPASKTPHFVIYQFNRPNGLVQLAWGRLQKNKPALMNFQNKNACLHKFNLISAELEKLKYYSLIGNDKTQIVKKNNLLS